ncbi:MAG: tetratricopeptide repeat protein [Verrucomicrobiota bacterium]
MPIESEVSPERKLPPVILPWVVAAGALAVYLLTLNRWVSFGSLGQVARLSGWLWQPELYGPVYWLLTYPLSWLPARLIPIALNLFSALCAALSLALLARSVILLPHDRTHEQRQKRLGRSGILSIRSAWLPPVLAALVCGLQLTFWEHATNAGRVSLSGWPPTSSEMLDLLLFAYVVRCLLEFRVRQAEPWLMRAAFVCGAAITNNWAMIGFFPFFLAALVWIKGLSFFNVRFLLRLALCGVAALSLYLLLPLVQSLANHAAIAFWPALQTNLAGQKGVLAGLFRFGRHNILLLSLTSLVPILIISIRWASYFGDTSRLGAGLATLMFHAVHALFLVACIWIALDPPMSPRNKGFGIPFLTFYYLGCLSIGYFSGYFLLLFGGKIDPGHRRPPHIRLINTFVTGGVWLLLLLSPAALIYRNLPQIRTTNGPMLSQYAALLAQGLPPRGAVLYSDDAQRLFLMQGWAAQQGKSKDYLFVDAAGGLTGPLVNPDYHRFLRRKYGQRWPVEVPKEFNSPIAERFLLQLAFSLAATNSLYYLHPSFGYYFESFYPEPHGMVYKLNPYPTNSLIAPPLAKSLIAENEAFWTGPGERATKYMLAATAPLAPGQTPGLIDTLMERAHLTKEPNRDAGLLAAFYSRALNTWGVELQKRGLLTNAAAQFDEALDLNPENLVAQVNFECNKNLQAGHESSVKVSKSIEDEFGKYRNWDHVIGENGPFDEPNFCFEQGLLFSQNLHHQAAAQFERVKTLAPKNLMARVWLAQLYVVNHIPRAALQIVDEIRSHPALLPVPATNRTEMLFVEISAHLANGDLQSAERAVEAALEKDPGAPDLLGIATQAFMAYKCYTNALITINQELNVSPTNYVALVNKGYVCIWLRAYQQAIPPLTRVLEMDPNNHSALLNRAIAYLRSEQLDAAQSDYQVLQKAFPASYQVDYGLQDIAYQKKDTNAAIRYCQMYLGKAPTNSAEAKIVSARLKELKSNSPASEEPAKDGGRRVSNGPKESKPGSP